jgi:hypothetical protein
VLTDLRGGISPQSPSMASAFIHAQGPFAVIVQPGACLQYRDTVARDEPD